MIATFQATLSKVNGSSSTVQEGRGSDDDSVELDEDYCRVVATSSKDKDSTASTSETKVGYSKMSLKDELRHKIQERRKSTGAGDIEIKFEPPKKYPLTREEKRKRDFRRQRNRDSANRSRLKRKFKLEYLEKEVDILKKENKELTNNISTLKNVKKTLMTNLDAHKCMFTSQGAEINKPYWQSETSMSTIGPSKTNINRRSSGTIMSSAPSVSSISIGPSVFSISSGPGGISNPKMTSGSSMPLGPSGASMSSDTSGSLMLIGTSETNTSSGSSGTSMLIGTRGTGMYSGSSAAGMYRGASGIRLSI